MPVAPMATALNPNGLTGCSPWREPWAATTRYIKSPEGAICISNSKAKVMEFPAAPIGALC